ncbi:hypothetical protein FA13DRAFT_11500 [Coprinellus micaceus]|uniref:Uncharacterized protein n=1 Tax=Coprinellus micaceus TaxID=71717 RepID=A0A4Y7U0L0_COPMI|nr:hypothetical protein FA13DRAFT_11500 [Coprinellus micaceus]
MWCLGKSVFRKDIYSTQARGATIYTDPTSTSIQGLLCSPVKRYLQGSHRGQASRP